MIGGRRPQVAFHIFFVSFAAISVDNEHHSGNTTSRGRQSAEVRQRRWATNASCRRRPSGGIVTFRYAFHPTKGLSNSKRNPRIDSCFVLCTVVMHTIEMRDAANGTSSEQHEPGNSKGCVVCGPIVVHPK